MKKYIVSSLLVIVLIVCSIVPAHATTVYDVIEWAARPVVVNEGEDEWVAARDDIYSVFVSSASLYDNISYDALCDLCGDFVLAGYPCAVSRYTSGGLDGYVIKGTGTPSFITGVSINGRYLSDGTGKVFYAPYNTDALLDDINDALYWNTDYGTSYGVAHWLYAIYDRLGNTLFYSYNGTNYSIANWCELIWTRLGSLSTNITTSISNLNGNVKKCAVGKYPKSEKPVSKRIFPKWSVAEHRKNAVRVGQATR